MEFESLIKYLRLKEQERRLTSIDKSIDNSINEIINPVIADEVPGVSNMEKSEFKSKESDLLDNEDEKPEEEQGEAEEDAIQRKQESVAQDEIIRQKLSEL